MSLAIVIIVTIVEFIVIVVNSALAVTSYLDEPHDQKMQAPGSSKLLSRRFPLCADR